MRTQDRITASGTEGKARWSRLAALGFGLAAAAPALMLLAGVLFGLDLTDAVFFVIPIVVLGTVSVLVAKYGTWAKITGIVLGLLAGLMFFWLIFGLFVPSNIFDFLPGLMFMPGVLIGIVSSIAALRAARRGAFTPKAEGGEARGIRIVLATLAALAVLSGILTVVGRSTADATGTAAQVSMKSFEFAPKQLTVAGGSTIFVENDDPFFHTFTVDELGIDESFTLGTSKTVTVPDQPGTYIFYCTPHSSTGSPDFPSSDDMAGRLIIT